MAKFKVVLEFHYDSEEDISDWMLDDCKLKAVTTADEAIEVARAEVRTHSEFDFIFKVYDDEDEFVTEG